MFSLRLDSICCGLKVVRDGDRYGGEERLEVWELKGGD
jgi:hypothetical protein